jgi:hypothetical protein
MFIATWGRMALLQTDNHLELCRLCLAMGQPAEARAELEIARGMIDRMGYHLRDVPVRLLEEQLAAASGSEPVPASTAVAHETPAP